MFCLTKEALEKIKLAIKDGSLSMEKFNTDSKTRRKILEDIVGKENAEPVNTLFEKNLLLKNQEAALYKTIKEITGITEAERVETLAKIKQTYADKNRRLYDPAENEVFLNEITSDIYSKKYKTEVSLDEAQTITELAADVKHAREKLLATGEKGFGAAKVAIDNYVGALKNQINERGFVNPLKEKGALDKLSSVVENAKVAFNFIADNSRSIVAAVDNSFWGRQGYKTLANPRFTDIWLNNFIKSWTDIAKTIKGGNKAGDAVIDGVKAEIYERPNYLNGRYELGKKLDIGTGEEAYPTSLPSKIPALGRLFRASEVAYEAGAMRLRADLADKVYQLAEKNGIDLTSKEQVGAINQQVNSMTGRGSVPFGQASQKAINSAFFSIKFLKSNLDFLTDFANPNRTTFVRKQAAINLINVIATTGVLLSIAKALNPNDNKDIFNPTSSNFGKVKNGNVTIDFTAGMGGLIVLAAKMFLQKSTNVTTGITTKLGEAYGSKTGMEVLWDFTENKFSPMFSVLKELFDQKTFAGGKPTVSGEASKLVTPIVLSNVNQFKNETAAKQLIGLLADSVGLSANVINSNVDWTQKPGVELQAFKTKVGDTEFKKANDSYNKQVNDFITSMKDNQQYQNLSDEEKQKVLTNKKDEIKTNIFKQYQFKYKAPKSQPLPKF